MESEIKLSLFSGDMIVYVEYPRGLKKKKKKHLSKQIGEFSKVVGY